MKLFRIYSILERLKVSRRYKIEKRDVLHDFRYEIVIIRSNTTYRTFKKYFIKIMNIRIKIVCNS